MPALTLKPSISLALSAAVARPSIHLSKNSNAINPFFIPRTLVSGAYLPNAAHVRVPTRIKPHSSSTSFPFVGGSLIAVSPQFHTRPAFCLSSLTSSFSSSSSSSSSQGGGGKGEGGDSDTRSGSEVPGMGHEHRYGDDYCRNDHGSPRLLSLKKNLEKEKSDEEKEKYARLLTLPTVLTLARVAAVPAFVCTFYVNSWWGPNTTTSIFIAAAITDWLDGYLARKMRLGTAFGAFLDPVADKLMVATTLVLLCSRPLEIPIFGDAPWLFAVPSIAIIGREITMSAVREWAASQQGLSQAVAVNNLGKWKTATQMIALTILLACRDSSFGRPDALAASGVVLLYVSAWLAVWSLIVYMRKIWKVLLK